MEVEVLGYVLRPMGDGMNWGLYQWRDVENRETGVKARKLVFAKKYPHSLEHGLKIVYRLAQMDAQGKRDIEGALEEMRRIEADIERAVERSWEKEEG